MINYFNKMICNIKNAQLSGKNITFCKKTKFCENFLKILWSHGFIIGYKTNSGIFKIFLKYKKQKPTIFCLQIISKPTNDLYYTAKQIWKMNLSGKTILVFSTSFGLQEMVDCKKQNIGGKLLLILN